MKIECEITNSDTSLYHRKINLTFKTEAHRTFILTIHSSMIGCGHSLISGTNTLYSYRDAITDQELKELKDFLYNLKENSQGDYMDYRSGIILASCKETEDKKEINFLREKLGFVELTSYINPYESYHRNSLQRQCLLGFFVNVEKTLEKYELK